MRKQSINGIEVIFWYDNKRKRYVIIQDFYIYYSYEKPVTDQEIEDMLLQLEQTRLETEYWRNRC